jgi:hypothetical protein
MLAAVYIRALASWRGWQLGMLPGSLIEAAPEEWGEQ